MVDNALNDISYRANINGMKTATPVDNLHAIESDVIPKLLKIIYSQISDTSLTAIDFHVENVVNSIYQ